jgi:Transposase DDE domain
MKGLISHSKLRTTTRTKVGQRHSKGKGSATPQRLPDHVKPFNRTLHQYLCPRSVSSLARNSGFQQRHARKLSPWLLVQSACLLVSLSDISLRTWAMLIGLLGGGTLATQSLHERLNDRAVAFLQAVLQALVEAAGCLKRIPASVRPYLACFQRVLLEDSTTLPLGAKLAACFPGPRNRYGTAATLKIQSCYDLCHQCFVRFALSGFRRNDQAAARDVLRWAKAGDLIIRDLGYFVLAVLEQLQRRGAFFLSRLRLDVVLYEPDGQTEVDLLRRLRRQGRLDEELLLGQAKVPVRVVAVPVAPEVAAERRRKVRHNRDQRSAPTARRLALLGWSIFITNVPRRLWPAKVVVQAYGLRWRVETIFKTWKSHFDLGQIPEKASAALAQTLVYAKLIFIVLFNACFWRPALDRALAEGSPTPPSLLRVSQWLAQCALALWLQELGRNIAAALKRQLAYHCRYQTRRRTHFLQQMLTLAPG